MKPVNYQKCDDIHILRARIAELETILFRPCDPKIFNLTLLEHRICTILATRDLVTKEYLYTALYNGWHEVQMKIIDVFICKIRKKLPSTIMIETVWGRGFRMTPESRKAWADYISAAQGTIYDGNLTQP